MWILSWKKCQTRTASVSLHQSKSVEDFGMLYDKQWKKFLKTTDLNLLASNWLPSPLTHTNNLSFYFASCLFILGIKTWAWIWFEKYIVEAKQSEYSDLYQRNLNQQVAKNLGWILSYFSLVFRKALCFVTNMCFPVFIPISLKQSYP